MSHFGRCRPLVIFLSTRAGEEEAEDRLTLPIAAKARAERRLPSPVSAAMAAGDSLLKAVRRWRGLTQAELTQAELAQVGLPRSGTTAFSQVSLDNGVRP